MASTNTRLMKLFWFIEDGANPAAIMNFLTKTARKDFKSRSEVEKRDQTKDEGRSM